MKSVFGIVAMVVMLHAGQYDKVKISPLISYVYVYHKGKAVKVHRIQDTKNKLTREYAKVYRPGKFIQPIRMDKDIPTIGEIEVIDFMRNKVNKKKGLIIDVRNRDQYANESIPSAVNIPFKVIHHKEAMSKIFRSLGMKKNENGSWDSSRAMELIVYCNGLWCRKSSDFIKKLVEMGYPKEKIKYYRGGFQMWKILGFTTVKN
jgi:rhodanese-related sulfurtransferase